MKRFIIVVDMQRDFVATDGALSVAGAAALPAPMRAWLATLRPETIAGVLFTRDTHDAARYAQSEEATEFPPHCLRGTPGWELLVDAAALPADIVSYTLDKGVFDMWAEPGLTLQRHDGVAFDRDLFFAQLRAQDVALSVVGVAADYCVRWAVEGLIARGFAISVPTDLTRGIARQIEAVAADEWATAPVALTTARGTEAGPDRNDTARHAEPPRASAPATGHGNG